MLAIEMEQDGEPEWWLPRGGKVGMNEDGFREKRLCPTDTYFEDRGHESGITIRKISYLVS